MIGPESNGETFGSWLRFPDGKRFAFTILDDTDYATVENIKPIYDLLTELGLRTTKTVWVFPAEEEPNPFRSSQTLADPAYLAWVRDLQRRGFEIAFHGASMLSSERPRTIAALERFRELLGAYPTIHVNHSLNRENLYWGLDRLDSPLLRTLMRLRATHPHDYFQGHRPGSPYYWGDICQQRITYVRSFTFREINLLRVMRCPLYHDPRRPAVPYWFVASDGADWARFNRLLRPESQERSERQGGVCIVYTHFGERGFVEGGRVNPETRALLTALARRPGWFVPVTVLLDHLRACQRSFTLSCGERFRMEARWMMSSFANKVG